MNIVEWISLYTPSSLGQSEESDLCYLGPEKHR